MTIEENINKLEAPYCAGEYCVSRLMMMMLALLGLKLIIGLALTFYFMVKRRRNRQSRAKLTGKRSL